MLDVWRGRGHSRERAEPMPELLAEPVGLLVYDIYYLEWSQNQNIIFSSF